MKDEDERCVMWQMSLAAMNSKIISKYNIQNVVMQNVCKNWLHGNILLSGVGGNQKEDIYMYV